MNHNRLSSMFLLDHKNNNINTQSRPSSKLLFSLLLLVVGSSCSFSHPTATTVTSAAIRNQPSYHTKTIEHPTLFRLSQEKVPVLVRLTGTSTFIPNHRTCILTVLRGGQQEINYGEDSVDKTLEVDVNAEESTLPKEPVRKTALSILLPASMMVSSFTKFYTTSLQASPILTKSLTAGFSFALSDIIAQRIAKKTNDTKENNDKLVGTRIFASTMVGLLYFGPAAHYWYEWIFRILPSTTLYCTFQKAALGQLLFGPACTAVFFASSLIQSKQFSLSSWFTKIKNDLPSTWLAGISFWPIVDLISYSFIPPSWIPLFVNMCSILWTTFLAMKSYAKQ